MGVARKLAEGITGLGPDIMTDEVTQWTLYGLLDYMAVTLAGSDEPCTEIAAKVLGSGSVGKSLIFGKADRMNALDAALVNGTAAHAHDFDDMNNSLGGHPAAVLLPAIFAVGEEIGASGAALLHAYTVGFETQARIGKGVHLHHYEKGWHPTSTLGTFGATAACCALLKLNVDQTEKAMAIAASFASGIKSNFGTMVKPLHAGLACRNGVMAARFAEAGFDGSPEAFEHSQGFFEVYNGAGTYDIDKIFDGFGDPLDILDPGIAVKQYPCCGSTHSSADAAITMYNRDSVPLDQIKHVDVWTHPRRLKHTNRPDPQGVLDAKFSVQYVVSRCLLEGRVILDHFEEGAYNDPTVRSLMNKLDAAPHPDMDPASYDHFGAEIRIEKTDGTMVTERVKVSRGRTTADPIPAEKMKAKFDACAARVMSADQANAVYAAIQGIQTCPDIREFVAVVENGENSAVQAAE
jgi:2-methylcitrate dehydratase PrpD